MTDIHPAIRHWDGPLGLPRFEAIDRTDLAPAFQAALAQDRAEVDAIAERTDAPTFQNTIVALERSGEALNRVAALFYNLLGADSDETLRALERDIAPVLSRHASQTAANAALFARIDTLWQRRDDLGLTEEEGELLERAWKRFVRGGAALPKDEQERLAAINARLAELGAAFAQNVLADEASWSMALGEGDLEGLPASLRQAMAAAAKERNLEASHAVTLSRSIIEPFLTFSTRRDLRETAFAAWAARGSGEGAEGERTDNRAFVAETVRLRAEKAKLLGYPSFAHFKLEPQMAKRPEAVKELLHTVWDAAVERAEADRASLEELAREDGVNGPLRPHDWRHYAERLRARRFDFDAGELKSYLSLDAMIEAAFDVAGRLFGLSFEERPEIEGYHPHVRTFEVRDADGGLRAVFLGDYFARPSKRSGAWMSAFQGQHGLDNGDGTTGRHPIIVNVMNFAKAPEGQPTLLSMDDARTLFHEFGHALHGMLSHVTYPSLAGTAVARDFVELPSQLYEHWLTVPDVLAKHARHVETGEPMPEDLLEKVLSARTFDAGFGAVEFTASALVDMAFHSPEGAAAMAQDDANPMDFQAKVLERIGLPDAIAMRHATPHFLHVFAGDGYSAGYYSYMWSEVLDADAFAAFEETGDPFDESVAAKLREHVYARGGAAKADVTYRRFRGRMPDTGPMLVKRGLKDAA